MWKISSGLSKIVTGGTSANPVPVGEQTARLLTAYTLQIFDFPESRSRKPSSDRMKEVCRSFSRRRRRFSLTHSVHPSGTQICQGKYVRSSSLLSRPLLRLGGFLAL